LIFIWSAICAERDGRAPSEIIAMQTATILSARQAPAALLEAADAAPLPNFAVASGILPSTGISLNLAHLLAIARHRSQAADRASAALDASSSPSDGLRNDDSAKSAALHAAVQDIIHEPANSLQEVLAKFSAVKSWAELEDTGQQMERPGSTQTERMLWSICADLLKLSGTASVLPEPPRECRVSEIADQFRHTIRKFDEVDSRGGRLKETTLYNSLSVTHK
jgi:hypothetical protein